jgi:hypothetical protein
MYTRRQVKFLKVSFLYCDAGALTVSWAVSVDIPNRGSSPLIATSRLFSCSHRWVPLLRRQNNNEKRSGVFISLPEDYGRFPYRRSFLTLNWNSNDSKKVGTYRAAYSCPEIVRWRSGPTLSIHRVWECGMYDTYTRGPAGSNPVLASKKRGLYLLNFIQ